jgi:hypothetical protein
MEVPSETRDRAHFIVHFPGPGGSDKMYGSFAEDDFSEWHTFAVDWLPDRIVYYVDGVERFRVTTATSFRTGPCTWPCSSTRAPRRTGSPHRTTPRLRRSRCSRLAARVRADLPVLRTVGPLR